jgi:hypothetical protein
VGGRNRAAREGGGFWVKNPKMSDRGSVSVSDVPGDSNSDSGELVGVV